MGLFSKIKKALNPKNALKQLNPKTAIKNTKALIKNPKILLDPVAHTKALLKNPTLALDPSGLQLLGEAASQKAAAAKAAAAKALASQPQVDTATGKIIDPRAYSRPLGNVTLPDIGPLSAAASKLWNPYANRPLSGNQNNPTVSGGPTGTTGGFSVETPYGPVNIPNYLPGGSGQNANMSSLIQELVGRAIAQQNGGTPTAPTGTTSPTTYSNPAPLDEQYIPSPKNGAADYFPANRPIKTPAPATPVKKIPRPVMGRGRTLIQ